MNNKSFGKQCKNKSKNERENNQNWDPSKEKVQEAREVFFHASFTVCRKTAIQRKTVFSCMSKYLPVSNQNEGMAFYISLFPQNWPAWLKLV